MYKVGFGSVYGDFWLGNDLLHKVTSTTPHELLIHLYLITNREVFARYERFMIANEQERYRLTFGKLKEGSDLLRNLNNTMFYTLDNHLPGVCTENPHQANGFWISLSTKECKEFNPNEHNDGLYWWSETEHNYFLITKVIFMVRQEER